MRTCEDLSVVVWSCTNEHREKGVTAARNKKTGSNGIWRLVRVDCFVCVQGKSSGRGRCVVAVRAANKIDGFTRSMTMFDWLIGYRVAPHFLVGW